MTAGLHHKTTDLCSNVKRLKGKCVNDALAVLGKTSLNDIGQT